MIDTYYFLFYLDLKNFCSSIEGKLVNAVSTFYTDWNNEFPVQNVVLMLGDVGQREREREREREMV